jgi:hypothetical protein
VTAATECGSCGAPNLDGATLCNRCTDSYLYDLAAVDDALDTLRPTVERQDVNGDSMGSSGHKVAPAPLNLDAMAAEANLQLHVRTTGRRLLRAWTAAWEAKCAKIDAAPETETPQPKPARPVLPPDDRLALWIIAQHNLIRKAVWAPGAKRELAHLLKAAQGAAERQQPKVFAGTCGHESAHPDTPDEPIVCGAELYALPGDDEARCKVCGSTYAVQQWRAHGRTAAEYAILSAPELSRALGGYGLNIRPATIRQWATRKHISRANPDHDEDGRPIPAMYRLGDALDTYQRLQIKKHEPKENTP